MGRYKFEIHGRRNWRGKKYWYVSFVAPNGETMNSTETFNRIEDAQNNIDSVKRHAPDAEVIVVIK